MHMHNMHVWAGIVVKVYGTKIYIFNIIFAFFIDLPILTQNAYRSSLNFVIFGSTFFEPFFHESLIFSPIPFSKSTCLLNFL